MSDAPEKPPIRDMTGVKSVTIFATICAVLFGMWWVMVGSLPHVPTDEERSQQLAAESEAANAKLKNFVDANPAVKLTAVSHELKMEDGLLYVEGIIANESDHNFVQAIVHINLYDKSGSQVDTTAGSINNLEAKGKWHFKVLVPHSSGVAEAKIYAISGL